MKRKLIAAIGILFCLLAVPATIRADTETFTPPAEKGKIYIIVRFGQTSGIVPKDVRVSIKWGGWNRSGTFNSGGGRTPKDGFVIRLNHTKNDSIPLTVTTSSDANIERIYQGGEPSQKGNGNWHYAEW